MFTGVNGPWTTERPKVLQLDKRGPTCTYHQGSGRARTLLHVSERWVTEAVRAQGVALATGPRGPQHQLKVIQRTAQLLVQLDGSVLGKTVGLITVGAVEPAGFGLETQRTC